MRETGVCRCRVGGSGSQVAYRCKVTYYRFNSIITADPEVFSQLLVIQKVVVAKRVFFTKKVLITLEDVWQSRPQVLVDWS